MELSARAQGTLNGNLAMQEDRQMCRILEGHFNTLLHREALVLRQAMLYLQEERVVGFQPTVCHAQSLRLVPSLLPLL